MQSPVPSVERGDLSDAETSLAVVLASVSASKNSCAHVTADHQVSVKTFCGGVEDLDRCHTGPSVRDWRRRGTHVFLVPGVLFHSDDGPQRVRRGEDDEASRRRRSTLLLLLGTPPVSAVMQCVPDAGEDPFADVKELIRRTSCSRKTSCSQCEGIDPDVRGQPQVLSRR